MARDAHTTAAEHHESAAKSHRAAAEHHGKNDHAKGKEHSTSAQQLSQNARKESENAHSKSQQQDLLHRHVEAAESRRLGIKSGWYGTKVSGTFVTGPHASEAECVRRITELNITTP